MKITRSIIGLLVAIFLAFVDLYGQTVQDMGSVEGDRAALVAFYNATNGPEWKDNTNWLSDKPLGEWFGVSTDAQGRVDTLRLYYNDLSGPIPVELGNLNNLTVLNLGSNRLSGPIPVELGNLTNLTVLNLVSNQLSGPIPVELGNLTNLTYLYLNINRLSGPLPVELGNLTNLTELNLASNQLSGPIPVELGNLTNLTVLDLWFNGWLSGSIPVELGNLTNLTVLDLSGNQLSGSIPFELGNLTNLTRLSLGNNQLSGSIPVELGNLTNLTRLWLGNNRLSGPIPVELGNLTNLTELYLSGYSVLCLPESLQSWAQALSGDAGDLAICLSVDVGEPRKVRMIYFLPNDRPFRQDVVDAMKDVIPKVQTFFADQMAAHGYGRKTFRYETDAQGEPLVHRVDGQHPDSHYFGDTPNSVVWDEIARAVDIEANVYFIVIDNSTNLIRSSGLRRPVAGWGTATSKNGGFVLVPGSFSWRTVVHEFGHAFGAVHDHRDGAYIMSYAPGGHDRLSACLAKWLAVHPAFNPDIPIEDTPPPTIEHINAPGDLRRSIQRYPAGSTSVSVQFKVSDPEGLHQVLLLGNARETHSAYDVPLELIACRGLAGETEAIVEFEYDGAFPSYVVRTSLSDFDEHRLFLVAVDRHGNHNIAFREFYLSESSPHYRATLEGHTDEVSWGLASIAFSPNGAMLATGGSSDAAAKVWDVKTKQIITTLDTEHEWYGTRPTYVAFSPDGAILAYGAWEINLWDIAAQTRIATLAPVAPRAAENIAFSPDGTMLVSSSRTLDLWDVKTKQPIATLEEGSSVFGVNSIAFSPGGAMLASGEDNKIILWDVATKQLIATLEHKAHVTSVAFSPDGTMLVSGSVGDDETVKVWDVKTKQVIATFSPKGGTYALAFSPDGIILASAIDGRSIALWDVKTKQIIATFRGHINTVRSIAFSPDGTTLASGDFDGYVLLWDTSEFVTPVVIFADANLHAVIRDALDKSAFAPITVTDMEGLTVLNASNRNIRELDGLESATNLTDLNLAGNPLSSSAISTDIPALQERGVAVVFDKQTTPDFDGDGAVTIADFLLFVNQFGLNQNDAEYDARFDLDGDGVIGIGDFLIFVNAFGNSGS